MKKYQYQLVRYIHDRVTSEFVNVGIIVFQPDSKFLGSRFISKYGRVSQFFSEINGRFLMATLKQFEREVKRVSKTTTELFFDSNFITEISNSILPKDDSALECSEIFYGIDLDPRAALDDLFERLVNKYNFEPEKDSLDDKHVWRNVYKTYFDKYRITNILQSHSVETTHDTMRFDRAWKNGIWHCYQTVSFDLKRTETIKNKVYKWSGIINELENSKEKLHLYFLTLSPSRHRSIKQFIEETLSDRQSSNITVSVIYETQADRFARSLSKEIEEHTS